MTTTSTRHFQLWIPLTILVAGSAISLSVGLGQRSVAAIVIGEVVTVVLVAVRTVVSVSKTDFGAVFSNQVDERQELIRLKASRVCAIVGLGGAVVACVAAAAAHQTYWPYELIYIVAGISYLIGLWAYGADREASGAPTPSPDQLN